MDAVEINIECDRCLKLVYRMLFPLLQHNFRLFKIILALANSPTFAYQTFCQYPFSFRTISSIFTIEFPTLLLTSSRSKALADNLPYIF
jgi:hypothetical protein